MKTELGSSSIEAFCDRHHICRATFYNLMKAGKAPRTMKVGSRRRITLEAEAEWQHEREAEVAALAAQ